MPHSSLGITRVKASLLSDTTNSFSEDGFEVSNNRSNLHIAILSPILETQRVKRGELNEDSGQRCRPKKRIKEKKAETI